MTIDEALAMGFTIPTVDGVNIIVNNTAERMRVPVRAKGKPYNTNYSLYNIIATSL